MRVEKTQEELVGFLGSNCSISEVSQSDYMFIDLTGANTHGFETTISVKVESFLEFLGIESSETEFYWEYSKCISSEGLLVVENEVFLNFNYE